MPPIDIHDSQPFSYNSGKQCILTKFCKSLLVGSAPKPLKTRACALWLCRIPASFDLLAKSLLVGSAPKPLKTRACALWLCRIPASFDLLAAPEIQKRKAPVPVMLL